MKRSELLLGACAGGLVAVAGFPLPARATPSDVQKLVASTFGATPAQSGKITLTAPEIAENGAAVPVTVGVDSPMTDQSYVKTIMLVADGNPLPGVARFELSPANGKAEVQLRIRLAQTQNLSAYALMNDGTLWTATRHVKVTIGGCGG